MVCSIIPNLRDILTMVEKAIFRPLPFVHQKQKLEISEIGIEIEDKEDLTWFHLRPIYQLLFNLILSEYIDTKSLKPFVTC